MQEDERRLPPYRAFHDNPAVKWNFLFMDSLKISRIIETIKTELEFFPFEFDLFVRSTIGLLKARKIAGKMFSDKKFVEGILRLKQVPRKARLEYYAQVLDDKGILSRINLFEFCNSILYLHYHYGIDLRLDFYSGFPLRQVALYKRLSKFKANKKSKKELSCIFDNIP